MKNVVHRIDAISFRLGIIDCSCGQPVIAKPDPQGYVTLPDQLAEAYRRHRDPDRSPSAGRRSGLPDPLTP